MATTIRLTRLGGHRKPFYRIVVVDSRNPRDGRFIEKLGHYDPLAEGKPIKLDVDKAKDWLSKGAKPSATVEKIFKRMSVI